jgi:hypothetical protein
MGGNDLTPPPHPLGRSPSGPRQSPCHPTTTPHNAATGSCQSSRLPRSQRHPNRQPNRSRLGRIRRRRPHRQSQSATRARLRQAIQTTPTPGTTSVKGRSGPSRWRNPSDCRQSQPLEGLQIGSADGIQDGSASVGRPGARSPRLDWDGNASGPE